MTIHYWGTCAGKRIFIQFVFDTNLTYTNSIGSTIFVILFQRPEEIYLPNSPGRSISDIFWRCHIKEKNVTISLVLVFCTKYGSCTYKMWLYVCLFPQIVAVVTDISVDVIKFMIYLWEVLWLEKSKVHKLYFYEKMSRYVMIYESYLLNNFFIDIKCSILCIYSTSFYIFEIQDVLMIKGMRT